MSAPAITLELTREEALLLYQILNKAQVSGIGTCLSVVQISQRIEQQIRKLEQQQQNQPQLPTSTPHTEQD